MHLCQLSSDQVTINITCSPKIINWYALKVVNLTWIKDAIWRYLKLKIIAITTNMEGVLYQRLLCASSTSPVTSAWHLLFSKALRIYWHCHSAGTVLQECQLETQMSIICVGQALDFAADTSDNFHLFLLVDVTIFQLKATAAVSRSVYKDIAGSSPLPWTHFNTKASIYDQ